MKAPKYINKELNLISDLYFVVHDPLPRICGNGEEIPYFIDRQGRWLVRKWKSAHPINQRLDTWRFNSVNILTINETDNEDNDIGYHSLDMRTIDAMRMGFYWARNAKYLLQNIDRSNDDLVEKADIEEDYIHRHGAKMMWKYNRESSVFLGG